MKILSLLVVSFVICSSSAFAFSSQSKAKEAKESLEPFPVAEAGYERFVFRVPEVEDESEYLVSLVIGKTVETDGVNTFGLGGKIEALSVPGWGYTYYKVESEGQMFGTLMAAPPGAEKVERFVEMRSNMCPIRYNSKLPYVVIVPEGFEVKYRVWKANEVQVAEKE